MDAVGGERRLLRDILGEAVGILLFLLFPLPLGLLVALGVPVGWTYTVVYAMWAVFVVFLAYVGLRRRSMRKSRWPHRIVMDLCLAGLFIWYFLTHYVLSVSVALDWFVFLMLAMGLVVEASLEGPKMRAERARAKAERMR